MLTKYDQPFGIRVAQLIQSHDLSVAEAASMLGYKSKTSLVRVLRGEANLKSCEQCLGRLADGGLLDDASSEALATSLDVLRMGHDRYDAWQSIGALLRNEQYEGWANSRLGGSDRC